MSKAKNQEKRISLHDQVLNSKLDVAPLERKKGILYGEAVQLLFKKIGITEEEINAINLKSIRNNKKMARQFEEEVQKSKVDVHAIIKELSMHNNFNTPVIRDLPVGSIVIPVQDPNRFIVVHQEGSGTAGVGDTSITDTEMLTYTISFTPTTVGVYVFSIPFFAVGPYFMAADDGPCNDKYAEIGVDGTITGTQAYPSAAGPGQTVDIPLTGGAYLPIFKRHETNATVSDRILFGQKVVFGLGNIQKDMPVTLTISLRILVKVSGEGSIAEVNFGQGAGIVWCPEVDIAWIGLG